MRFSANRLRLLSSKQLASIREKTYPIIRSLRTILMGFCLYYAGMTVPVMLKHYRQRFIAYPEPNPVARPIQPKLSFLYRK